MESFARKVWPEITDTLLEIRCNLLQDCGFPNLPALMQEAPERLQRILDYKDRDCLRISARDRVRFFDAVKDLQKLADVSGSSFVHDLGNAGMFRTFHFVPLPHIDAYFRCLSDPAVHSALQACPELPDEECLTRRLAMQVLYLYTTKELHEMLFKTINAALRTRTAPVLEKWTDVIFLLDYALRHCCKRARGVFYRGIGNLYSPEKFREGAVLRFSSVVSASGSRDIATGFAFGKNPVLLCMSFIDAREVDGLSYFPFELEVCAPPQSRWEVTKVADEDGMRCIYMQQLPSTSTLFPEQQLPSGLADIVQVRPEHFLKHGTPPQGPNPSETDRHIKQLLAQFPGPCGEFYRTAITVHADLHAFAALRAAHKKAQIIFSMTSDEELCSELRTLAKTFGWYQVVMAAHDFDKRIPFSAALKKSIKMDVLETQYLLTLKVSASLLYKVDKYVCRALALPLGGLGCPGAATILPPVATQARDGLRAILTGVAQKIARQQSAELAVARWYSPSTLHPAQRLSIAQRIKLGEAKNALGLNKPPSVMDVLSRPVASGCPVPWSQVIGTVALASFQVGKCARDVCRGEVTWSKFQRDTFVIVGTLVASVFSCNLDIFLEGALHPLANFALSIVLNAVFAVPLRSLANKMWTERDHPEERFNELRGLISRAVRTFDITLEELCIWDDPRDDSKYQRLKQRYRQRMLELHPDHFASLPCERRDSDTEEMAKVMAHMQIIRNYRKTLHDAFLRLELTPPTTREEANSVLQRVDRAKPRGPAMTSLSVGSAKEILRLHYDWTHRSEPKDIQPLLFLEG